MFKSAATKIAHNSTLPSLAGNYDLKPLQDLINVEKVVLTTLQKLSADFARAADALRAWGMGEGEDLGDTLSASTNLLNYFSNALSQFATHEHTIREHMKAIRTREENLDELKRRRRALVSKADAAEKKLSKMSPEHKNLHAQMDTLNRLRDEIRMMDSEIMSEESALGDFKRSEMRTLLGLKFGGLLECCEKGTIAGEFGKLVVMEIPNEVTQPGMSRSMYVGHQKVYSLLQDAQHCVSEIAFSTVPSSEPRPPRPHVQDNQSYESPNFNNEVSYLPHPQGDDSFRDGPGGYLSGSQEMSTGHFMDPSDMSSMTGRSSVPTSPVMLTNPSYPPIPSPPSQVQPNPEQASKSTDDFGVGPPTNSSLPTGGRFATFPVKAYPPGGGSVGYQLRDDPPALHSPPAQEDDSFSSSIEAALKSSGNGRPSFDGPPPSYIALQSHASPNSASSGVVPPPQMEDHWQDAQSPMGSRGIGGHDSSRAVQGDEESDEGGLPYDRPDDEAKSGPPKKDESEPHKHVRFGEISDVEEEIQKRQEQERSPPRGGSSGGYRPSSRRVPPPTFSPEDDEKELNAAAAREISREMDALNFSAHGTGGRSYPGEISPTTPRARNDSFSANSSMERDPSPLIPPLAPFAQRGPSPRPEPAPSSPTTAPPTVLTSQQSPLANISPFTHQDLEFDQPTSPIPPARDAPPGSPMSAKAPVPTLPRSAINVPAPEHRSSPSMSSLRGGGSPYQTPPEFPLPRSPLGTRSSSSLVGGDRPDRSPGGTPAPPPPGVRTISAAAFRRQPVRNTTGSGNDGSIGGSGGPGVPETSPLHLKKRLPLPSSPYPSQRGPGLETTRDRSDSEPYPQAGYAPSGKPQLQDQGRNRGQSFSGSADHGDDQYEFDYLSAYTNPDGRPPSPPAPGSPLKSDFGSLGNVRVTNDSGSLPPGAGPPTPGGYGDGRFATNLESESLR
ncbi:hypothetical protein L218DRAFT_940448 [Marasmius fiardii PR-910]|nr:hypothetical protein L218DRAFT_940448 [Marasmius fiardii PR-910]